jgi:hypothetical protein
MAIETTRSLSSRMTSLLLAGVLVGTTLTACNESFENRARREAEAARERKQQLRDAERAKIVEELRTAHGADAWRKGSFAWTADVQEGLIRTDGRPIAGIARLADVEKQEGSYWVHLVPESLRDPPIEFVLKCGRPEVNLRPDSAGLYFSERFRSLHYPVYAFVATIRRVKRQDPALVEVRGESVEVTSRLRWVAEGECLALREIPKLEAPPEGRG